jgi:hypothetical protein
MRRQDGASGAVATSWGGEFLRRATPQANDGSGSRRQRLWKMAATQWKIIGVAPFKGQRGMGVLGSSAWSCRLGIKKKKKLDNVVVRPRNKK